MNAVNSKKNISANILKQSPGKGKFQFTVNIKDRHNSIFSVILPGKSSTVSILKHRIAQARGIQPHLQKLIFNTTNLSEGVPICNYGITHGSTILLVTPGGARRRIPKKLELGVFTKASSFNIEIKSDQSLGELKRKIMNLFLLQINGNTYGDHNMKKKLWNLGIKQGTVVTIDFQGAGLIKAVPRGEEKPNQKKAKSRKSRSKSSKKRDKNSKLIFPEDRKEKKARDDQDKKKFIERELRRYIMEKQKYIEKEKKKFKEEKKKFMDEKKELMKKEREQILEEVKKDWIQKQKDKWLAEEKKKWLKEERGDQSNVKENNWEKVVNENINLEQFNIHSPVAANQAQLNETFQSPTRRDLSGNEGYNSVKQSFISTDRDTLKKADHHQKKVLQSPGFKPMRFIKLVIQSEQNQNFNFSFSSADSILDIKEKLHKYTAVPIKDQILQYADVALDNQMTIEEIGLVDNSIITMKRISTFKQNIEFKSKEKEVAVRKTEESQKVPKNLEGNKILSKGPKITVTIEENTGMRSNYICQEEETVADLQKKWYKSRTGGDESNPIAITLNGLILDEDVTLKEQGITSGTNLKAIIISRPPTAQFEDQEELYSMTNDYESVYSEYEFTPIEIPRGVAQVGKSPLEQLPTSPSGDNRVKFDSTKIRTEVKESHYTHFQKKVITSTNPSFIASNVYNNPTMKKVPNIQTLKAAPKKLSRSSKYISQQAPIKITDDINTNHSNKKWTYVSSKREISKAYTEFGGGKFNEKEMKTEERPDDISTIGINVQPKKNSKALKIPEKRLKNATLWMKLVNGKKYSVRFDLDKTVFDLKSYVEQVVCISRYTMRLMLGDVELEDEKTLMAQGAKDGDEVDIVIGSTEENE